MMKTILPLLMTIITGSQVLAMNRMYADPDLPATAIEYRGVPAVKVGDYVRFWDFSLGGFIEARNEERFDRGVLPNHNWRGFAFLEWTREAFAAGGHQLFLTAGAEHESAHPTGGFHEDNNEAYEMIYDGLYRNINLNSLLLGFTHAVGDAFQFRWGGEYQFYFLSKNTPELHDTALTFGHGVSAGLEVFAGVRPGMDLFISVFDRYIFQSGEEREDWIYHDQDGSAVQRYEPYPVINAVNTVVVKGGLLFNRRTGGRKVVLYGKVLYGNIFGFVDSREERLVFSAGIELVQ